jgi:RNA polymerase sigma-70 factor (ECF subfamily)
MALPRIARPLDDPSADPPDPTREPTDDELLARVARGDGHAFERVAARWGARVRDYLLRLTGERDAAEDLLQEVLVRLYRSAAARDFGQPFAVWLFTIARNAALSHLRRRDSRGRLLAVLAVAPRALLARFQRHSAPAPPDELIGNEFAAAFDAALRALPEEFRSIFLLREREALSYEEIAAVVGIPAKTVSTRLVRAREKLRRELSPWLADTRRRSS